MIYPQQNVFPLTAPVPHEHDPRVFVSKYHAGIDLRTWMTTQLMAAFIANKGFDGMGCIQYALQTADALITELNKTSEVAP